MRILIAEPDEYYHSQFLEHLGSLGEIRISRDGGSLKKLIDNFQPDALITELVLGDLPAYSVLLALRNSPTKYSLPIIVFSKIEDLEDIQEALGLGVSGYFVKGKDTISDIRKLLLNLSRTFQNTTAGFNTLREGAGFIR